ncbi:hypothetical protein BD414DRAFT_538964 [Trametes punicea]|nr:hypothetical protein BD414DRAFT_538964 [Trametes punicea]
MRCVTATVHIRIRYGQYTNPEVQHATPLLSSSQVAEEDLSAASSSAHAEEDLSAASSSAPAEEDPSSSPHPPASPIAPSRLVIRTPPSTSRQLAARRVRTPSPVSLYENPRTEYTPPTQTTTRSGRVSRPVAKYDP